MKKLEDDVPFILQDKQTQKLYFKYFKYNYF